MSHRKSLYDMGMLVLGAAITVVVARVVKKVFRTKKSNNVALKDNSKIINKDKIQIKPKTDRKKADLQ